MRPIGGALPEARFVHLIRDGRDVAALAPRARDGRPASRSARSPSSGGGGSRAPARQAERLRGRYLELRYEDLVADPEPALRRVCELVELDYDPAMLAYHERAGERLAELGDLPPTGERGGRAASERSRRPRARHASRRARRGSAPGGRRWTTPTGAQFEAVAGDLLAELGYDVPS